MTTLRLRSDLHAPRVVDSSGAWVLLNDRFFDSKAVRRTSDGNFVVEISSRDASTDAALQALIPQRSNDNRAYAYAHRNDGGQVRVIEAESRSVADECNWSITLRPEPAKQQGVLGEISISTNRRTHSADDIARMRAARILYEPPNPEATSLRGEDHMLEVHVQGLDTFKADRCFVQEVFSQCYAEHGDVCAEWARLVAIWALKATNAVDHVEHLALGPIEGGRLRVQFRGRRRKVFSNVEPVVFELVGQCPLLLPEGLASHHSAAQVSASPPVAPPRPPTPSTQLAGLAKLLRLLFNDQELRAFLRQLEDGEKLLQRLPGQPASLLQLIDETVDILKRHGFLDLAFFEALVQEFPRRRGEIATVASSFGFSLTAAS